jgi:hypothetical protein
MLGLIDNLEFLFENPPSSVMDRAQKAGVGGVEVIGPR